MSGFLLRARLGSDSSRASVCRKLWHRDNRPRPHEAHQSSIEWTGNATTLHNTTLFLRDMDRRLQIELDISQRDECMHWTEPSGEAAGEDMISKPQFWSPHEKIALKQDSLTCIHGQRDTLGGSRLNRNPQEQILLASLFSTHPGVWGTFHDFAAQGF